ncbi:MAG: acetoacetate decarboxylase family protein [Gammaproteobacteria bacterium]|nr:acetoacetate decarboxylase family protein [Gammaproteobacteria bacterium]
MTQAGADLCTRLFRSTTDAMQAYRRAVVASASAESADALYRAAWTQLCGVLVAPGASLSLLDGLLGEHELAGTDANLWPPAHFEVQTRAVAIPVRFWAAQGIAMYAVDPARVRAFLPDAYRSYQLNGKALFALRITDYLFSDLGPYYEIDVAFGVLPRQTRWPVPGTYALQMLVTSPFACKAGHVIWGYPKTVADLQIQYRGRSTAQCTVLNDAGKPSIVVGMSRGDRLLSSPRVPVFSYTQKDGQPFRTRIVRSGHHESVVLGGGGVQVQVHDDQHRIGHALRALGVDGMQPFFHLWTERMGATLEHPHALR